MQKTTAQTERFIIRITDTSLSFARRGEGQRDIDYEPYELKIGMSVPTNLREAFRTSRLLQSASGRVTVTLGTPPLLVPIDDYDESRIREQYKYVFPDTEGVLLRATVLPATKTMAVCPMSKDLGVVLSDHFDEVITEPVMARLWDFFIRRDESLTNRKIYVYFHESKLEIFSFTRRRFAFANTFQASETADALYYILGAWQQTGCNAEKDFLVVCGDVPEGEALTKELRQYIGHVHRFDPRQEFVQAPFTSVEKMPLDMMMQFV